MGWQVRRAPRWSGFDLNLSDSEAHIIEPFTEGQIESGVKDGSGFDPLLYGRPVINIPSLGYRGG